MNPSQSANAQKCIETAALSLQCLCRCRVPLPLSPPLNPHACLHYLYQLTLPLPSAATAITATAFSVFAAAVLIYSNRFRFYGHCLL